MKITIDTKEDTVEEIKSIIKMLSSLVGEKSYTNQPNIFESSSPEVKPAADGNVFGNIFDNTPKEEKAETTDQEGPKMVEPKVKDENEEDPQISAYF